MKPLQGFNIITRYAFGWSVVQGFHPLAGEFCPFRAVLVGNLRFYRKIGIIFFSRSSSVMKQEKNLDF